MTKNKRNNAGFLEGSLLIATPLLQGSCFEKSVVYICLHNEAGAMGILVNHALENLKYVDIFSQLNIRPSEINHGNAPVYFGGPTESAKGFILHTNDYFHSSTQILQPDISLTSTIDILQDIASGNGPRKKIFALGCSGWAAGQIEQEIKENSWITISANESIIFDTNNEDKWQHAINTLGIDFINYSSAGGNA